LTKLKGKTAIVIGASSGIGAAIGKYLADAGANVVLAVRRKEKLDALVQEIHNKGNGKALAITADVTVEADVQRVAIKTKETFGHVDIMVNNAGLMLSSRVTEGETHDWEQM